MRADIITLKALFQKDVRYVIPTFQRPYVWNQEDQWEPLWNDVRNTAEDYLEALDRLGEDKQAAAENDTEAHFLGAIVLQQQATATPELEARQVIDGQQRLTTLQLLLDAAQEVFERDGHEKEARQLRKLVLNDADYAENNPDNIFKVWPTLVDQDAFRHAMSNDLVVDGLEDLRIVEAHEFFKIQIRQWLVEDAEVARQRSQALVSTLLGLLQIVVIDLQSTDDANIIFETLNARGTPLLASDLIKNSILHSAGQLGMNGDAVYEEYWQGFDQPWWRIEIGKGGIVRPRIDVYLNYWLTMRTAEEVRANDVFRAFRSFAEHRPIVDVVSDIKAIAKSFRQLEEPGGPEPLATFLYRWHVMDAGVTTPVILWLLSNRNEIETGGFATALGSIESYLVRRMVCRMSTKDYNKLFLELIEVLNASEPEPSPDIVHRFLSRQTSDSHVWPTDRQLRDALLTLPLYQLLTRGRLRIVLEGLEDVLRSPKSEEERVPRNALTIEHVMPQAWRQHWPLSDPSAEEATEHRDRLIQTIGNLTLVNEKLNPALSNDAWPSKRQELAKHSVLYLNKALLDQASGDWDEEAIHDRGSQLAELMAYVWPGPAST